MKCFIFVLVILLCCANSLADPSCESLEECERLRENLSQQLDNVHETINTIVSSKGIRGLEDYIGIGPVENNPDGTELSFGDDVNQGEIFCREKYGTRLVSYEEYQRYANLLGAKTPSGYQNQSYPNQYTHSVIVGGHQRAAFDFSTGFLGDDGRDFAYLNVRCKIPSE